MDALTENVCLYPDCREAIVGLVVGGAHASLDSRHNDASPSACVCFWRHGKANTANAETLTSHGIIQKFNNIHGRVRLKEGDNVFRLRVRRQIGHQNGAQRIGASPFVVNLCAVSRDWMQM